MFRNQLLLLLILCMPLSVQAAGKKLNPYEYKVLTKTSKLMEADAWNQAREHLQASVSKVSSDYAKALVYYNLGQIFLKQDQYRSAIKHLKKARSYDSLEPAQNLSMLRTIGQLHCSIDQWKACTDHLEQWAKQTQSLTADDHLLFAQAYSQQDRWKKVIPHIETAIRSKRIAPENWYQLLVVSNVQLKRWKSAIAGQRTLIQHYSDSPSHWRQLVSLHLQNGQSRSALSVQRMSVEKGVFTQGKDYRLLAQLYLQNDMPFYAGQTIETAFKKKRLKQTTKNLELLSASWIRAKEDKKAIRTLTRLTEQAPTVRRLKQMAQLKMQLKDWKGAIAAVNQAMPLTNKRQGDLQLLRGIAQTNLKRYDSAQTAFQMAARDEKLKHTASNWLRYLDQIVKEQV